ncbi:translation initiation factor IF-2-like [Schistocerca nitens]|uniref:translation initiation factor IF-2-like n=1 Tax=Schistocerca nitens TaxID=7011 RepID=UPI0021176A14|nr:translation initiation factor IF-2-like [Schistocerca nitens]
MAVTVRQDRGALSDKIPQNKTGPARGAEQAERGGGGGKNRTRRGASPQQAATGPTWEAACPLTGDATAASTATAPAGWGILGPAARDRTARPDRRDIRGSERRPAPGGRRPAAAALLRPSQSWGGGHGPPRGRYSRPTLLLPPPQPPETAVASCPAGQGRRLRLLAARRPQAPPALLASTDRYRPRFPNIDL